MSRFVPQNAGLQTPARIIGIKKGLVNCYVLPEGFKLKRPSKFQHPAIPKSEIRSETTVEIRHPKIRNQTLKKRYRADSNCCKRFCRPLPSPSATVPCVKTGVAKIGIFIVIKTTFAPQHSFSPACNA